MRKAENRTTNQQQIIFCTCDCEFEQKLPSVREVAEDKSTGSRTQTRALYNSTSKENGPSNAETKQRSQTQKKKEEEKRFGANARLKKRHERGVADQVLQKTCAGKGAERTEASGRRGQRNICATRGKQNRTAV
jgi:hypothetical protein